MLSFLHPGLLWALPLAAGPILLHLFFLRRARVVRFSDLTLLRAAYAQARPATRLRQWLLLLFRCLLIAALIFVFARPVFHGDSSATGGADQGIDLVVLMDTSWSMGVLERGKSRFAHAHAVAETLLGLLQDEDRVAVASFSDKLDGELQWAESRLAAREGLARMHVGPRVTDVSLALREAYRFLKIKKVSETALRKRVVAVLSDGAEHIFSRLPAEGLQALEDYDREVSLIGLRWDEALSNAGVLEVRSGVLGEGAGGERGALRVRTALYGKAREGWSLDLFLRGRRSDQRTLRLEEGISPPTSFRLPASRSGEHWGRLELKHDALALDDVYYFSMRVQPKPKVLLIYGSQNYLEAGQGGYFLRKLLGEGKELPYHLDLADAGKLKQIQLEEYSAVLLADFKKMDPHTAEDLHRYVARGGGLWLIAGTRATAQTYLPLARMLPGSLGEAREIFSGGAALVAEESHIPQEARPEEFKWDEFEMDRVDVSRSYALSPSPEASVWFKDAGGRPLMLAGRFGQGRVLLWASALEMNWSNLALKPVFTAWLDVGLRHLTRYVGREQWHTLRVGEPITRVWRAGEKTPGKVQIRGPDGRRATLLVRERAIRFTDTRIPGHYFLQGVGDDSTVETYAVNADRSGPEGDLSRPRVSPWAALRPEAVREDFLQFVYGKEIRTSVLAVVLLLLLLELMLSRPRALALVLAIALLPVVPAAAQEGDRFVWSQMRYTGAWDPYPNVHTEILHFVTQVTSVIVSPGRRVLSLKDPVLFDTPYILLSGKQAPPDLDEEEIGRLRDYLTSGGFLWIEDATGAASNPFDRWVRRALEKVLPDSQLRPLPSTHVLFKTFFLLRRLGGRVMISGSVEGVDWAGKTVVVYSRNDLLGAWAKDPLGNFLHECVPGGEAQRMQARKLSLNIILYALTGSYKADAVHQPFILQKMLAK